MREAGGSPAFSWFPGHMRVSLRRLEGDLRLADAVILVLDARIPRSCRYPELEDQLRRRHKPVVLVLNKSDLADEEATRRWLAHLRGTADEVLALNATGGGGPGPLKPILGRVRRRVEAERRRQGLLPREPRLAVVGLPNVGKSSLLNRLVGARRARTGRRPGVTRGPQWVGVAGRLQVLDSPGILYPRIEGEERLVSLAAVECLPLERVPAEQLGALLLARLQAAGHLDEEGEPLELLVRCGRRRGFRSPSGEVDTERTALWVLRSFSRGKLGRITLETP